MVWFGLYFDNAHTIKYTLKNGHYPGELHLMEVVASHRATEWTLVYGPTDNNQFCGFTIFLFFTHLGVTINNIDLVLCCNLNWNGRARSWEGRDGRRECRCSMAVL